MVSTALTFLAAVIEVACVVQVVQEASALNTSCTSTGTRRASTMNYSSRWANARERAVC
jgi:hypothetical protein